MTTNPYKINYDLKSDYKMFRLLQGDVGSGKTIIAFVSEYSKIDYVSTF